MASVNQLITKGISLVTKYADDAARMASTSSDDVARYVKACGKRSILQTKPLSKGFKIDPSKLGYEYEKGKYIFATEDAAKEYAKMCCLKPAKLPLEKQYEVAAVVEGRKFLGYSGGFADSVSSPIVFKGNGRECIYDFYHYHPSIDKTKTTLPVSDLAGDLEVLRVHKEIKSMTAFNELGEYNTVEVINSAQFREYEKYKGILPPFNFNTDAYRILEDAMAKRGITEALAEKNTQKYAQLLHEVYKETLHKFGLKYTTNFSNLA